MKKIIVTGGLGFIGSNLIELLLEKKYKVINIDKNTYSSNFYNVKELKKNKNYSFIKCDIANRKLAKIINKHRPIITELIEANNTAPAEQSFAILARLLNFFLITRSTKDSIDVFIISKVNTEKIVPSIIK